MCKKCVKSWKGLKEWTGIKSPKLFRSLKAAIEMKF